jgi:hypothetical protein
MSQPHPKLNEAPQAAREDAKGASASFAGLCVIRISHTSQLDGSEFTA